MLIIYTDGSCIPNPGPGGWAAFCKEKEKNWIDVISGRSKFSTNNRMELTAVIKILEKYPNENSYIVYSDSEYVIKGITIWIKNWIQKNWKNVKNSDLWKRFYKITRGKNISWKHVRAHRGNPCNELVDKLAKLEAMSKV